jgi:hypothetical protein
MSSLLDGVPANIQRDEDDALVCLAEMKVFAAIPTVIERPSTPTPKIMLMYPPKMKAFDPQEWKQTGDAQRWTEFKLLSDAEAWEYREINRAIDTLLLCAMIREAGAAGDEQGALDVAQFVGQSGFCVLPRSNTSTPVVDARYPTTR